MTTVTTFEARCWGGPLDGEWVANDTPFLKAARHKPIRWDSMLTEPADPVAAVGYWVDRYTFERVGAYGSMFAAWVIESPPERREAVMQTILEGLDFVWAWCRVLRLTDPTVFGCECRREADDYPDEGCIDGSWYGFCSSDMCGGMCDFQGTCPCPCHNHRSV